MAMETLHRHSLRFHLLSLADKCLKHGSHAAIFRKTRIPISVLGPSNPKQLFGIGFVTRKPYSSAPSSILRAGWFLGLGDKKKTSLPDIVKAGDPVLHEQAREVGVEEIGSERIQKIVDDMVRVMRKAPGVGLAAPQIGIPLRIIVLEDTNGAIYAPKEETKARDRRPFDLLFFWGRSFSTQSLRRRATGLHYFLKGA